MKLLKILVRVVVAALVLVIGAAVALYVVSGRHMARRYDVRAEEIAVPADAQSIARGAHVAIVRGCTSCHGGNLAGQVLVDDSMFGRAACTNLTSGEGGVGGQLAPADWEHAVRHGVARGGRALLFMPSMEMQVIGDGDLADLIAYARSLPAVDQAQPASRAGPIARMLIAFEKAPLLSAEVIDHGAAHAPTPAVAMTTEYGGYLAAACTGCHQPDFAGGPIPGMKGAIAANLTMDEATGLGGWSEADFVKALRTGVRPDGRALDRAMPWPLTAQMTDTELRALWLHFRSLPTKTARTE